MASKYLVFSTISFILTIQRINGNSCSCRCGNKYKVCDDLKFLRTLVDANIADLMKWNKHYEFLKHFHNHWKTEMTEICREEIPVMQEKCFPILKDFWINSNATEEIINGSKIVLELLSHNEEWESRASNNDVQLRKVEDRVMQLESDLQSEKEVVKKRQDEQKRLSRFYRNYSFENEKKHQKLENQVSDFKEIIQAAQTRIEQLEENIKKEQEMRKKMEATTAEIQSTLNLFGVQIQKLISSTKSYLEDDSGNTPKESEAGPYSNVYHEKSRNELCI